MTYPKESRATVKRGTDGKWEVRCASGVVYPAHSRDFARFLRAHVHRLPIIDKP
jgi:hypothetical protein